MTQSIWAKHGSAAALCTALLLLVMAACATAPDEAVRTHTQGVQRITDPATVPPGKLLESSPSQTVDVRISRARASATHITYRSTSGVDGRATTVTGMVFTPNANPPPGGWPVVAYGHPGAGIRENCAPSQHPNLLGNGAAIESLLRQGYLVVIADYQGIGSAGPHPFLESKTLGYNMIDAVRAAKQLEPAAGPRWSAYGLSEGGEAAWAAAELAPSYGQGLEMVAAAALNPTADMSAIPYAAMNGDLTPDQLPMMQYIANTVASLYPDVPRDDYVRGYTRDHNDALMGCSDEDLDARARVARGMMPGDVAPVSPEAADRLAAILRDWALPGSWGSAQVPILVMVGGIDATVWTDWTWGAVQAGCDKGERIMGLTRPAEGHDDLEQRQALAWLRNQFQGNAVDMYAGPLKGVTCNGS
jgi:secretory lipase